MYLPCASMLVRSMLSLQVRWIFQKHPRLLIIATQNLFWKCYSVGMLRKMLFLCIFWLWLVGNQAHLANADRKHIFFSGAHLRCHLQSETMLFGKPLGTQTVVEMRHYETETEMRENMWTYMRRKLSNNPTKRINTVRKRLRLRPQCHRKRELQTWTKVLFRLAVLNGTGSLIN